MTKQDLIARIKRDLGFPLVKIELSDPQIEDEINDSINK
jgi:hypothetical protein